MRLRSITRQTVIIVLVAQISFALLLGSVAILSERHTRMRALEQQIAGRSDSLLGAIQDAEDPEDNITVDPAELRLPADDRYAVYSDTGKLIGRSLPSDMPLPKDGEVGVSELRVHGVRYSVLRRSALRIIDRLENGGVGLRRPVVIVYASPEDHVLHEVFEAIGRFLLSIVIASIAVASVTALLLRRTLQPIRELALAAQRVSPSSLTFRSPEGAMQVQELRPLATALSALIDELREAFAKEQRFVGDAAHELKTAVAVVRSSIQVTLLRRRKDTEYIEGLQQVLRDTDRVESLLTSMLELARREQIAPRDVPSMNLAAAVERACETMRSVAEARGVRLVVTTSKVDVNLDPDSASTLLINLLSNAIRHSKAESTVRIKVLHKDGKGTLMVEDDGDGIRSEALPLVFDRFYRDDPSRSRLSGGTGLGLAICKSIVHSAGGTIGIASKLGQGTLVTVIFSAA